MKRVVVTGMAGVTALGNSWAEVFAGLRARRNAIRRMHEWERYTDMGTKLAAPVPNFAAPEHWTRKQLRGMGRVSQLAVRASELALEQACLLNDPFLKSGNVGVACGSCVGSTQSESCPDVRRD